MIATVDPQSVCQASGVGDHISHSQINGYSMCSLKWWLSRRFEALHAPAALVFGVAFHNAMQQLNQAKLEGRDVDLDDLMDAFDKSVAKETKPIEYGKKDTAESLRQAAQRMFNLAMQEAPTSTVIGVEEPFSVRLADDVPVIIGYIDLIELREDDEGAFIELVDYKTAGRMPSDDSLPPDQLILYSLAVRENGLLAEYSDLPVRLRYRVVTKTKEPKYIEIPVEPNPHEEARLIAKIEACVRGMKNHVVFPSSGWACASCQYRQHCALWPNVDLIEQRFPLKGAAADDDDEDDE